jgi:hypothetical protein
MAKSDPPPQKDAQAQSETLGALYGGIINGQDPYYPTEDSVAVDKNLDRWKANKNAGHYPKAMTSTYDSAGKKHVFELRPGSGATAYMVNHTPGHPVSDGDDDYQERKHLWVNKLSLGWVMDYKEAQTVYGKSFYPRHIRYQDAVVRGQTVDQNHYDEIVEAIISYQKAAINGDPSIVRFVLRDLSYHVNPNNDPYLWNKGDGSSINVNPANVRKKYSRIQFDGYPVSIKAGHTKKSFQPEYEIRFALLAYQNETKDVITDNDDATYKPKLPSDAPYIDPTYSKYTTSLQPKFAAVPSDTPKTPASNPIENSGYSNFNMITGGPSGNGG